MNKTSSRFTKTHLNSKKIRTASSRRWLLRQLNDPYVQAAQHEGYRSRAAFKLLEIQDKYQILKPGQIVVDLGAAPGGWTQVVAPLVKATDTHPIIAIDLLPMDALPGAHILQGDFLDVEEVLKAIYPDGADVILSDMAPAACGISQVDHLRIMGLVEAVFEFAQAHLRPGGAMVVKVLQGGTEGTLLNKIKKYFTKVHHFKPPASRQDSREMYLVALGWRGEIQPT